MRGHIIPITIKPDFDPLPTAADHLSFATMAQLRARMIEDDFEPIHHFRPSRLDAFSFGFLRAVSSPMETLRDQFVAMGVAFQSCAAKMQTSLLLELKRARRKNRQAAVRNMKARRGGRIGRMSRVRYTSSQFTWVNPVISRMTVHNADGTSWIKILDSALK